MSAPSCIFIMQQMRGYAKSHNELAMLMNELIGPRILAAAGQIHYETVLRWRRQGKLPPYDVDIGQKLRGWKIETLRAHHPSFAVLVEQYLAQSNTPPAA